MINDMPLPVRKLVRIRDSKTGVNVEVKQTMRRNKYYCLLQLKKSEPEVYETIMRIESALC